MRPYGNFAKRSPNPSLRMRRARRSLTNGVTNCQSPRSKSRPSAVPAYANPTPSIHPSLSLTANPTPTLAPSLSDEVSSPPSATGRRLPLSRPRPASHSRLPFRRDEASAASFQRASPGSFPRCHPLRRLLRHSVPFRRGLSAEPVAAPTGPAAEPCSVLRRALSSASPTSSLSSPSAGRVQPASFTTPTTTSRRPLQRPPSSPSPASLDGGSSTPTSQRRSPAASEPRLPTSPVIPNKRPDEPPRQAS